MHSVASGHLLFAIGLGGMGALSLGSGDFAYTWQPVPDWIVWRSHLAHASGLLMLAVSIGILVPRIARASTLIMTIYLTSWALLLHAPRVARAPADVGMWLGVSESTVLLCGGWILFLSLPLSKGASAPGMIAKPQLPRFLFGAACLILGLSHFVYANFTAGMVPVWLPDHVAFAYLTGAGHFCAGLAVLFGVLPRLAATLEAGMITSFVLLVHVPGVFSAPSRRLPWTMMFVALALAGSAWVVAGSLRASSWGWAHRPLAVAGQRGTSI
jgi:uncharacterized membrane protein